MAAGAMGWWVRGPPLLAEPDAGTVYPSTNHQRSPCQSFLQDLKRKISLVDFTGGRTCHELSDNLPLWQTA